MGLELYPGRLKNQADSIIGNLREDNQALLGVLDGISQFTGNEELKSAAWSSMKGQLGNHQAVIQGLICGNEAVIQGNETLKGAVGDEDLVEDELNAKIESLQASNLQMQSSISTLENCMRNEALAKYSLYYYSIISMYQGCISAHNGLITDLQEKIERLYQIEAETSSLFAGADSLYGAVSDGIAAIGKGWNGSGYVILSENVEWRKLIGENWKIREERIKKEIEEFLDNLELKCPAISDEELLKIFEYAEQQPNIKIGSKLKDYLGDVLSNAIPEFAEAVGGSISKLGDLLLTTAVAGPAGENSFLLLNSERAMQGSNLKICGGKISSIGKVGGWILTGIGFALGVKDDIESGKTIGEAISHSGISTGIGMGGGALATSIITSFTALPVGWVIIGSAVVGVVACELFEKAYENNFLGVQDVLNDTGRSIDEGIEWAKEKIGDLGECLEDLGESVNPFNWAW